jgi:hypothetical protein
MSAIAAATRLTLPIAALLGCLVAGCAPRSSPPSETADRVPSGPTVAETRATIAAEIETTMVRFSLALAAGDSTQLLALTAPGFTLLEDGRTFDRAGMVLSARQMLAMGTMIRTPVDFTTEVRNGVAWTHYHVVGEFRTDRQRTLLTLLESAVLERDDGRWRIAQMSTLPETVP